MSFRLRDLCLAVPAFLLLSPLMVLITLILFFTQKRVFFLQPRPGRNEKVFMLVKFSTLRDVLPGEDEYGDLRLRLTPVGKFLRKFSLDEILQLWNVITGDMSLVGPRPLLTDYLPLYDPFERLRHRVRPGITGWAQVNGRNKISFKEKFRLDVWYVQNQSHLLDLKILLLTVVRIFNSEAVYRESSGGSGKYDGTN
ncbi:MAG: sugar transferase [Bacteroidia bacterium]